MPLRRRALSLMELLVVLVILIATAGLVAYLYSSAMQMTVSKDGSGNPVSKSIQQIGTEATMAQIRNAIVGTPGHPGYWNDILSSQGDTTITPSIVADLFRVPTYTGLAPYSTSSPLFPTSLQTFNPNSGRGWHGPYILQATGTYPDLSNPKNAGWITRGFTTTYYDGAANDPALIDAWGNPIVIQWPSSSTDGNLLSVAAQQFQYVRLISAGPNGVLDTLITDTPYSGNDPFIGVPPKQADIGDDVILYLRFVP